MIIALFKYMWVHYDYSCTNTKNRLSSVKRGDRMQYWPLPSLNNISESSRRTSNRNWNNLYSTEQLKNIEVKTKHEAEKKINRETQRQDIGEKNLEYNSLGCTREPYQ